MDRTSANRCRFDPARAAGHYESYFQRANHPSRPLAFWIRYTIFSPKGRPDQTVGELWASYFDGEKRCITAVKEAFPLAECRFSPTELNMQIGRATLDERSLHGEARTGDRHLQWNLNYSGDAPPLLLLSPALYNAPFPKAKSLVGTPLASYGGLLIVDGETIPINGWVGSQNHNWGSRHIDHYAWGQVAGFDGAPDAFLEISTARIRLGPVWSPWLTPVVLRAEGQEYALNGLLRSALSFGSVRHVHLALRCRHGTAADSRGDQRRARGVRRAELRQPARRLEDLPEYQARPLHRHAGAGGAARADVPHRAPRRLRDSDRRSEARRAA